MTTTRGRAIRMTRLGALLGALVLAAASADAADGPRPAAEILRDIEQIDWPGFLTDLSMEEMGRRVEASTREECALAEELWRDHPNHPELPRVLRSRWVLIRNVFHDYRRVFDETTKVLDADAGRLEAAARYERAAAAFELEEVGEERLAALVEEAVALESPPGAGGLAARLLTELAWHGTADPDAQKRLIARVLKEHRKSEATHGSIALYKALKHVGSAPTMTYRADDEERSLDDHRGRPVLLFFFGSHCFHDGTPRFLRLEWLKRLRADGAFDGVDIIGVMSASDRASSEELADAVTRFQLDFPLHRDGPDGLRAALSIGRTPCFVLLDERGVVRRVTGSARRLVDSRGAR